MSKARFDKSRQDLLIIAGLTTEARKLAFRNRHDLLTHLLGMVECEIVDLLDGNRHLKSDETRQQH